MRALAVIIAGLAFVLAAAAAQGRARQGRELARLGRLAGSPKAQGGRWEAAKRSVIALAAPLAASKERGKLGARLASAGFFKSWSVSVFLLAKLSAAVLAVAASFLWLGLDLSTLFSQPMGALKCLVIVYLAAKAPDWWLGQRIEARRAKIRASIPQAIDLMTICVESGLSLEEAFDRVGTEFRRLSPEVAAEFRTTRSEMLVIDRREALKRLEKRSGVKEMGVMASSLIQSLSFGTPLAEALRGIAADCRAAQVSELEEKAGAISAKTGIPLVLLILFPLVAIIAAPAVINLARSFFQY
jgi:tight adherence protein C